jgi:ribonuclease VapC
MGVMVADTSALLAIIQNEPECEPFLDVIRTAQRAFVSAVSILEAGIVLHARRGLPGTEDLFALIEGLAVDIAPFDAPAARQALNAYRIYGKGVHAEARLNLGDCAVYALAKGLDAPLLFKGNDFAATDLVPAYPRAGEAPP